MAREIRHYVSSKDGGEGHVVAGDSVITALSVFVDVMKELIKAYPGADAKINFSSLAVGSLDATMEYELSLPDRSPDELMEEEARLEVTYVSGWAALASAAVIPEGFTRKAVEHVGRFAQLLAVDGFRDMQIFSDVLPVTITSKTLENVRVVLGESFTDIGGCEGRLETISLAGRPTFNIRDEVFGTVVTCAQGAIPLDDLKDALGRRVHVYGEITYNRTGFPSEISPVMGLELLDSRDPVGIERIIGLGVGLEGSTIPSEQYVEKEWDGN